MASIIKRKYKVTLADGTTVMKQCEIYTIEYTGADGRRRREKGYSDRKATEQKAARLEKAIARGAEGLEDPFREEKARATEQHIRAYLADKQTQGKDDKYVENLGRRLRIMAEECPWPTLGCVNAKSFIRWRDARAKSKRPGQFGESASAETLNQYLETAQAFLNWCAQADRIEGAQIGSRVVSLVLAGVAKAGGEKKRNRRALSDGEVGKLLASAPHERAIIYRTGLSTGLRRQELNDLKWGDVRLNAIKPYLALRAMATKARRADAVPLPQSLADALRVLRGDAKDGDKVFPIGVPEMDVWRADLKSAGIVEEDGMGRKADFHGGTRKTLCSRLNKSGSAPVKTMRLMRVTDARLVTETYNDDEQLGLDDPALPEIEAAQPASNPIKVAGA